jgi:putative ABC transport system substrate-binding protein
MMRRRYFMAGLGSAATWPLVARAQQPVVPVIGYLDLESPETRRDTFSAFHRGLAKTGYFEGRNLVVEYRPVAGHYDRLRALAGDLVHRQVAAIVAFNTPSSLAAKAATTVIPVVFSIGSDPVRIGLVASLNRPGGNITGVYNLDAAVTAKRLQLLQELLPAATSFAALTNTTNTVFAEIETRELQIAARTLGVRLLILSATDQSEIEAAFATVVNEGLAASS